jgi:hypothetical protein
MKIAFTKEDVVSALSKTFQINAEQIEFCIDIEEWKIFASADIPAFRRRKQSKPIAKQERLFLTEESQ